MSQAINALGQVKSTRGARDKRLDEAALKIIRDTLIAGSSYAVAIARSGVPERSFYRWLAQGRKARKNTTAWQFWQEIEKAKAEALHRNSLLVQTHARKDWRAAAWFLERKDPDNWGNKEKVEITGNKGGPVKMEITSRFKVALERAYGKKPEPKPAESADGK